MSNYLVGQKRLLNASNLYLKTKANEREIRHIIRKW